MRRLQLANLSRLNSHARIHFGTVLAPFTGHKMSGRPMLVKYKSLRAQTKTDSPTISEYCSSVDKRQFKSSPPAEAETDCFASSQYHSTHCSAWPFMSQLQDEIFLGVLPRELSSFWVLFPRPGRGDSCSLCSDRFSFAGLPTWCAEHSLRSTILMSSTPGR